MVLFKLILDEEFLALIASDDRFYNFFGWAGRQMQASRSFERSNSSMKGNIFRINIGFTQDFRCPCRSEPTRKSSQIDRLG